jgi:hypothetical protein
VHLTRAVNAPALLERFLVAAVATVLVIRAWLAATGYPQIGGHGLHIAHMLFGGLGMLIALLMSLTLLGARVRALAALIGGIGFGAFIDELGKFITSDNNYFYQPTVALIYVIFVLLFLAGERLANEARPTPTERLAQATNVVTAAVVGGFPASERALALRLLDQSDGANPLVPALRSALSQTAPAPDAAPNLVSQVGTRVADRYVWLVGQPWFLRVVLLIAGAAILFSLREVSLVVMTDPQNDRLQIDVASIAGLLVIANLIAGAMLLVGLIQLRRGRLCAYRWFRRATLVSLLIAQPLAFYVEQWTALVGLAFSLVFLSALNFGIAREEALAREPSAATTERPGSALPSE